MNNILRVEKSRLKGKIRLSGAKNSALKLQTVSILTDENIVLNRFPNGLSDVITQNQMLEILGKEIEVCGDKITISGKAHKEKLEWNDRSIRNTLLIWGASVAKNGISKVPLPGGCQIGERKYDLHIMILEKLGAKVWSEDNYLCASVNGRLQGTDIHLPMRSTGATENAILSAALAEGKTIVWNPHIRPEVLDLIEMLQKMGAIIEVRGNESIIIEGVERLKGAQHEVIPDNMEALTFLVASVITNGEVEIEDFPYKHLETPLIFLKESGTNIFQGPNSIITQGNTCYPIEISTGPYPGINSDMQPLFAVYGACANGLSKIVDLRFPDRFSYAEQLNKMGVNTEVIKNQLVIKGGNKLVGSHVNADDLRAGAALLLAGLVAEGVTYIDNAQQISRGYENFIEKFKNLGAKIEWENNR